MAQTRGFPGLLVFPYTQCIIQQQILLALPSKYSANLKPLLPTTDPLAQAITTLLLDSYKGLLTVLFVFTIPHHPLFTTISPPLSSQNFIKNL